MEIIIKKVPLTQKSVLRNLLQLYQYDFTEFNLGDVNEHGLYEYKYLDHYWTEPNRYPFFILVDGSYAGFALVRELNKDGKDQEYSMAEFFILKKYRKMGIGKMAAIQLFKILPGNWIISETKENIPAQKFWSQVIGQYTNNEYNEIQKEEEIIQRFSTSTDIVSNS